jgi:S1-C subfamily serine protease
MHPARQRLVRLVMNALLGILVGLLASPAAFSTRADVANLLVVQGERRANDPCGWIGVGVSPMTTAFAESLGMAEPYGAIFDRPEPGSPAADAHIEQGDVLTAINGAPLMRAADFAGIISAMAAGTPVYLSTRRDGQLREVMLVLGSAPCRTGG